MSPRCDPSSVPEELDEASDISSSLSTADTDILSSPESTSSGPSLRSQPWPQTFPIPQFSYEVEVQLERANRTYLSSGTLLSPSAKLKSDILDSLASEIIKYKVYPSSAEFDTVAEALIRKHPCLKEQGSVSGWILCLLKVFRKKGGEAGRKIRLITALMDKDPRIERRRECVIRGLCIYLNGGPESLIKTYLDASSDASHGMEAIVMGSMSYNEGAESDEDPEDVGVIIEGVNVLQGLRNVANGCVLLLGLIYSLNLSYPKELKHTFEFLQKVVMELNGNRLSQKVQVLKNRLLE
ncbi:hypothetical protein D9C73_028014 [Collichthys lucidus]|uniref:Uncharacterized protein n=1 Tax=Collichthys lucidus TaxID=240159 RepID=A0A4V6ALT3_COLLU|nr:hypothetical protein D9C73_028014 [Collichthys lucidus]